MNTIYLLGFVILTSIASATEVKLNGVVHYGDFEKQIEDFCRDEVSCINKKVLGDTEFKDYDQTWLKGISLDLLSKARGLRVTRLSIRVKDIRDNAVQFTNFYVVLFDELGSLEGGYSGTRKTHLFLFKLEGVNEIHKETSKSKAVAEFTLISRLEGSDLVDLFKSKKVAEQVVAPDR